MYLARSQVQKAYAVHQSTRCLRRIGPYVNLPLDSTRSARQYWLSSSDGILRRSVYDTTKINAHHMDLCCTARRSKRFTLVKSTLRLGNVECGIWLCPPTTHAVKHPHRPAAVSVQPHVP